MGELELLKKIDRIFSKQKKGRMVMNTFRKPIEFEAIRESAETKYLSQDGVTPIEEAKVSIENQNDDS